LKPNLYDGSVIGKSDVIMVPDSKNTLKHAEESRSKMIAKQNDPQLIEKKHAEESRSKMIAKQNDPQLIEKKVITKPIDYATLNQLSIDFSTRFVPQTKSYAEQAFWSQYSVQTDKPTHSGTTIVAVPKELPKVSMELFTSFDQCLIDEVTKVQKIFKQMEMAVKQHCANKTEFQTKMENVLKENDRLLTHALSVKIVNIVVNDCKNVNCLNVDACEHCVTTESELKTDFIKKEYYETLFKQYHNLEKHCISLEVNNQLNTENLSERHCEKDTVILKLKEKIKSSSGDVKERKTYKQLFDSIKSSRVQSKEQCDDLINKVNLKSVEVADLNASLQEKVLVITALKEQLKGKAVRRTPQITKSEKTSVDTSPSPNIDSNTPVLSSTGVALVSSASGSQSKDNTKKYRIRRTHKKAKETELEDHPRKVKSSLNKASVVDSRANSSVLKSISNVNSNLKCASCNGCLFSNNHDACVLEYINSVNASRKSKSVKKSAKRKV
nr:hypothetical protein [Tanacetum cinerariifolium]